MQEVIMDNFINQALLKPLELLGHQVLNVLPNVLAMGIILLGGLFSAWALGFFAERLGMNAALLRGGVKTDPSRIVGRSIYWIVTVLASIAALGALNLTPINQFAQSLLAYVPHLVTAAVILLAGYFLSNFVSRAVLIAAVNAGLPPARLIATCSRWGIQALAGAMALEQLGIAQHIVVVGFGITWGGIVLAGAIAFGLGATDLAKGFLERRLVVRSKSGAVDDLHHL
jgi:hypothetical protein